MNNSYRGFTFLEMMVALSVIAIALVSMLASQSQSVSLSTEARFMTTRGPPGTKQDGGIFIEKR